jgi:type III secretion system FlhB-like substrate exporter
MAKNLLLANLRKEQHMEKGNETVQDQNNQSTPSKTPDNKGYGETPAGGTANPPEVIAKGEPTIAEHVETQAAALDEQINALSEKKDALMGSVEIRSDVIRRMQSNQAAAIDGEIATLTEKKTSILAILESLPEELHSLEARVFAALKHLF